MVAGELYDPGDAELVRMRARARGLLARYNACSAGAGAGRREVLEELVATLGDRAWIEPPFQCDYGWNISLGRRVFLNVNCVILDSAPVTVGSLAKIGPAVLLCSVTHPVGAAERESGLEYARPIVVGRNVWIGAGAFVGPGVTIGDNSVVGAGSVVVRDVPANVVAAGNPCRVLRPLPA